MVAAPAAQQATVVVARLVEVHAEAVHSHMAEVLAEAVHSAEVLAEAVHSAEVLAEADRSHMAEADPMVVVHTEDMVA